MATQKTYNSKEVCARLAISEATLRNWIKLKKIKVRRGKNAGLSFSAAEVNRIEQLLADEDSKTLKSRRNKSKKSGRKSFHAHFAKDSANAKSVERLCEDFGAALTDAHLNFLLKDCAIKLLSDRLGVDAAADTALAPLLSPFAKPCKAPAQYDSQACPFTYIEGEDTLGLLYLSLLDLKEMKASGTYYTPSALVNALIAELPLFETGGAVPISVLDPCCGTGTFLMRLPHTIRPEYLYGCDIDARSCAITRINLALKFKLHEAADIKRLQYRILNADFLNDTLPFGNVFFDLILGNPPWGVAYTEEEKKDLKSRFACAKGKTPESADLFIERALNCLSNEGALSFILPESLLYVQRHKPVRTLICERARLKSLTYLGNAFEGVQNPAVTMQLALKSQWEEAFDKKEFLHMQGARVRGGGRVFTASVDRHITSDNFHLIPDDHEYALLQRILDGGERLFLKDNAQFALGIVTGSNASMLFEEDGAGREPILTGSDIMPFRILKPSRFIAFDKDKVQQAAPLEYYRAPDKLLYRFVSSRLIFARDRAKRLSLNSCNVLIPQLAGYDTAYVMAILNSAVAQFFYTRTFRSIKVLRSYIEAIPIPVCRPATQRKVMQYVQRLAAEENIADFEENKKVLDLLICSLYGLTADDYAIIRRSGVV